MLKHQNWLNVANDAVAIGNLLGVGGIPIVDMTPNGDGTLNSITLLQFAATLQLGGTTYEFFPALKLHNVTPGIPNLASI